MILKVKKIFLISLAVVLLFSVFSFKLVYADPTPTLTPTTNPSIEEKQKEIVDLQNKIADLQKQKNTLASQITVMDSQIKLTQLRINATKQQIANLTADIQIATEKITGLEELLKNLTKVLLKRIVATYEVGRAQPFEILLSSQSVSDFFSRANYLRIVQAHDKRLIYETQQAKNDYTNQKEIFEDKKTKVESLKKQLENYTAQIAQEKIAKQQLLKVTQNDEDKYQELLAQALSEYQAIQGIISGKGQETEIKKVSEEQIIASVIEGYSCNSSGTHLHFMVAKDGNSENPFSYLRAIDYENCSGVNETSQCISADSFNPSGSWNWPLDPKIILNQGYGSTWAVKYTWVGQIYSFHNGIDIEGSSLSVKAVRSGTLFQGSYAVSGCRLRYVRIHHDDSGLDSFYLHINYVF